MIRFYVFNEERPAEYWWEYSIDDANERAEKLRVGGGSYRVEARDHDPEPWEVGAEEIGAVIDSMDRKRCRQIRWAGVAP